MQTCQIPAMPRTVRRTVSSIARSIDSIDTPMFMSIREH